jgi:hypothetical protein
MIVMSKPSTRWTIVAMEITFAIVTIYLLLAERRET